MKKVLTTAAALAMLAPTMTSFASSTNTTTVAGPQHTSQTSELGITGTVNTTTGAAPEGQISVTLPTAVSFIVHEDGDVQAANSMSIENKSTDVKVKVSVASFADTTKNEGEGITVVQESKLATSDRSFVNLKLVATGGESASQVTLLSEGIQEQNLVTLAPTTQASLVLAGESGQQDHSSATHKNTQDIDSAGTTDTFTVVFKVAKAQ